MCRWVSACYIQQSSICHPFIVGITAKVTFKTNSVIYRHLGETSLKWKGSKAEKSHFSIQFASNVFDLSNLNSYTIKLHLIISSHPSGSPEILPRDSRMCGYLLPFRILQRLQGQSCGSWPPYSPVLLETVGNALSDVAYDCCHRFLTIPLRCLLTSFPSSQTLVASFSATQDCRHCLVLQCQCSSPQNSPGKYCPSYLRHFWGTYRVLRLVKQPVIRITCHVTILQNQPSVLPGIMKILDMTQKMWQKTNWKRQYASCVWATLLTHFLRQLPASLTPVYIPLFILNN